MVLALGDRWAERLRRIAPNARVVVVPNPVTAVGPATQPAHGDPVQVVFLGEIGDRKGTFTLLDAWAKVLVESTSPVRLTIAGTGEIDRAQHRVRELGLHDTVTVRPWLTPGEVAGVLATAQVLCLPSRDEGQPMAVLEAMANGLCVVAGNVGGIPEMLADDCGLLVSPDSVDELAAALGSVVDDPLKRARLGGCALRRVRSHIRHRGRVAPDRCPVSRGDRTMRTATGDARSTKPLRVLYVVPDLGVGGAERHVATLLPGLDRSRFDPRGAVHRRTRRALRNPPERRRPGARAASNQARGACGASRAGA